MPPATTVTSTLLAISRDIEIAHASGRALCQARAVGRSIEHLMATCELSHACNRLTSQIATLRRIVLGFDQEVAGIEIGSLAELGLRGQTLAILLLLDDLHCALREDASRFEDLFTGRFHAIDDIVCYAFDSLARANRAWMSARVKPHAGDESPIPAAMETSRRLVYRLAIRRAQRAIAMLSADPDLTHFVRTGSSRGDAPEVRRACEELAQVFTVRLTREPDPELLFAAATREPAQLAAVDHCRGVGSAREEALNLASPFDWTGFIGAMLRVQDRLRALIGAIGTASYFDAWLAAAQVRTALEHTAQLAEALPNETRGAAVGHLGTMRSITAPILALAPSPNRDELRALRIPDPDARGLAWERMEHRWRHAVACAYAEPRTAPLGESAHHPTERQDSRP